MTAEMNESNGVLDCRTIEFEGKNGDLSGDLTKIDCNGSAVIEQVKDDVDGSYVFVNGGTVDHADEVISDVVEKDLRLEGVGDPTEIVETEIDYLVGEEERIESGDSGEKEMNGVSCKENLEFEVAETVVVEVPVSCREDCGNDSRVELDGDGVEVKHVVSERNVADVGFVEQDVEFGLESAEEEEMIQDSRTVANETAESEFCPEENRKDQCKEQVDAVVQLESAEEEIRNQETMKVANEAAELELPVVENVDVGIQFELADEEKANREIQTVANEVAEMELPSVENGDVGIQLESAEGEKTDQETQMVVNGTAEMELPHENADAEIQLEPVDEERTNQEAKMVANEVDELELPPDNGDAEIQLEPAEVERATQETQMVTNEVDELELPPENGDAEIQLEPADEERTNQETQMVANEVDELELPPENGDAEIQLEPAKVKKTNQETRSMVDEAAELELHPIENWDGGIQFEPAEKEETNQEIQTAVSETAELELSPIDNEDVGIHLETAEEERTNQERQTPANEVAALELPPIENGDCQSAEHADAGIQLQSEEEEMTQESLTVVHEDSELELPPVENGNDTEILNFPDQIQGEVCNKDMEPQVNVGVRYSEEIEETHTCPVDDANLVFESISKKDCRVEESGFTECSKGTSDSFTNAVEGEIQGDGSMTGKDVAGDDDRPKCEEVDGFEEVHKDEILPSAPEDHCLSISAAQLGVEDVPAAGATASEGQKVGDIEVADKQYLITIPRHVDNKIRSEIRLAQSEIDEKTRDRDSLKAAVQMKRATRDEYRENFEAAVADERAARAAADAKRQEIVSVQLMINRMKDATSIDEIDDKIHGMERMIAHETMPLKEEKQLIREIKQLKVAREQLNASIGKDKELQDVFEQRDKIEERFKILKQELETFRNDILRAEGVTKAHKKKKIDASESFKESYDEWVVADKHRQEAYMKLQNIKKQAYERNNHFRQYKADQEKAYEYASAKDREALQCHCSEQVESFMELWNKDDDFRKEYIKNNLRSTLRRFKTLDGRSLGPDEEPAVLASPIDEEINIVPLNASKKNAVATAPATENVQGKDDAAMAAENMSLRPTAENVAHKSSSPKPKESKKPTMGRTSIATVSDRKEDGEEEKQENEKTEEEELARKAEELRKEAAAAKLKEQRRLEEIAKAKEAEERKKRNAEKANARAELRAQKEAERKEKEREKRARKKAKKMEAAENSGINEETAPTSDGIPAAIIPEPETKERDASSRASKRSIKSSTTSKHASKPKPLVMPPRHRDKKKIQTWVWILLAAAIAAILILVSNGFTVNFGRSSFGF